MNGEIHRTGFEVAVIGAVGRFPGAENLAQFWENLKNGVESIVFFSDETLSRIGVEPELSTAPNYVKAKGALAGSEYFDAFFFGYSPKEAEIMDPQVRLFHEVAWEVLEDAGYNPDTYKGEIGMYVGASPNFPWQATILLSGKSGHIGNFAAELLHNKDYLGTRISYKLNLRGPSYTFYSTCSTSLVAVHIACRAVLTGECDMAVAGGVSVFSPQENGYLYEEGGVLAADGHIRAFDEKASGTVEGNGVGAVVLKPLQEAIDNHDHIYAVVKGSAINNDGSAKVSYTAPSPIGQSIAVKKALQVAEVEPESISYIEAHGTGTVLGDPIEIEALKMAFNTDRRHFCRLASVKSNVGHLDSAAGIVGFIKTLLLFKYRQIPPTLNFDTLNPKIDLENSPFIVNTDLTEWKGDGYPLRAGVNAFGFGGTNAHVILEEAPAVTETDAGREWKILQLSAKSGSALDSAAGNLLEFLKENPAANLADIAFSLQVGRKSFKHRRMLVCRDIPDAVEALSSPELGRVHSLVVKADKRPLIFMFPGQGSQYVNMGLELMRAEKTFRQELDPCFEILKPLMGYDLKEILYPGLTKPAADQGPRAGDIDQTQVAQPLLFVIEYALARLLMKWGLKPDAMIGHSIGEYVAACLSGVFSLEDTLKVVAMRGKFMQQADEGAMLSVPLSEEELIPLLKDEEELSLAAVNACSRCVVSGANQAIGILEKQLEEKGYECRRLHTSHAFHSKMMDPILKHFEDLVGTVKLNPPRIPYISNISGSWQTGDEATKPRYWAEHLRKTVRFAQGIDTLLEMEDAIFLEVGPGKALTTLAKQQTIEKPRYAFINLVRQANETDADVFYLFNKLGMIWLNGVDFDWETFYTGERRARLSLPTYSFERQLYPVALNLLGMAKFDDFTNLPAGKKVLHEEVGEIEEEGLSRGYSRSSLLSNEYVAPRSHTERIMAEVWKDFFGFEQLGINDDFFELGGDSLKAGSLVGRILKEFNVLVPLVEVFNNPTIKGLSEYIKGETHDRYGAIEAVEEKEYYPLSSAQKRLFILHRMNETNTAYNIPKVVLLQGELKKDKLEATFRKLINHHESLRTSFLIAAGEPVQRIHVNGGFKLEYFDTGSRDETIIGNFIRPFDLAQAPLLRVGLIKLAEEEHILMVDMHHIISDGISLGIFVKEFMALYGEKTLLELNIQYKDFSAWQNHKHQEGLFRQQEEFWLKQFETEVELLNLPFDYSRPSIQSFAGNTVRFEIGETETAGLIELALREKATLYMVLISMTAVLLSKITGQEDIVIGTPTAGRTRPDIEQIIGMFVNTVVLRNYPQGEKSFQAFLKEVRKRTLECFENQDYPFEDLVEKVALNRDVSRNPLFDVMFVLQNLESPRLEIAGLKLLPHEYEKRTALFDLTFQAVEAENKLHFMVEYSTKLFRTDTIERLVGYFERIVSAVVKKPGIEISGIEIISAEERQQVLFDFNNTEADYPADKTIQRLFEEQVEKTPDNMAVIGTATGISRLGLTYKELNRVSNQLAWELRIKGVAPNTIVGLLVEPSIEMISGILGILKAGGAYLPIDPEFPGQRILSILDTSEAAVLLTKERFLERFSFTSLANIAAAGRVEPKKTPPREQITHFDGLPFPDRTLVDYSKYHRYIGEAMARHKVTLQATRGCPFNCAFCHKIWPKKHVRRSAENIFSEIQNCYNAGVRRFAFIDDIFNLDKEDSSKLFRKIISQRLDLQLFFCNGLRGDILTKDYIDLMVEAGTVNIDVALESGSARIQKLIRKNLNLEKFCENIHYITQAYPQVILEMEMMLGFPTETEEEALMTLNLLKTLKWVHFPNLHVLKIYPTSDMARLAIESGIKEELIQSSTHLAFHELPETLPFSKAFAREFQSRFMSEYFLLKERLLHVLPAQVKILSEDELVDKYDSYLPVEIKSFQDILDFADISREELGDLKLLPGNWMEAPDFNERIKAYYPPKKKDPQAFKVLLLDISQLFSSRKETMLHNENDEPLGLMYLMSYLDEKFGPRITGQVYKSGVDFDSYLQLKDILLRFKPDLIGIRTLSYYREFFHEVVSYIRCLGLSVPIVSGGPYATSDYRFILQDPQVDVVVLGEGELTLAELVEKMMDNDKQLPGGEVLRTIKGITFVEQKDKLLLMEKQRQVIPLDRLSTELSRHPVDNPVNVSRPQDLLYLISTSGSSGEPKSVMLEHRNLANLLHFQSSRTNIDVSLRVLQFASIGFDVSAQEIFSTLSAGGTLYLTDPDKKHDISRLFNYIHNNDIRTLFLPPAFLKFVFENPEYASQFPPSISHLVAAGEQLVIPESLMGYIKENRVFLHNHYGPTETHVVSTLTLAPGAEIPTMPSIGKPISNTRLYILEKNRNPVPLGVPGELYISGASVGRGYYKQEQLTRERYIPDPFFPGQRMYRTGDLARWLADGNIEFIGRIDNQVKVRGYRIELGEIESQLLNHHDITDTVVISRQGKDGDKYLCAYLVAKNEVKAAELRKYLARKLPNYMIPSYFVQLEKIPLTSNGKIDKRSLASYDIDKKLAPDIEYVLPGTELEKTIASIWKEVLQRDTVGIHDNIFDVGGNSLKIIHINSRLKEAFKKDIPVTTMFEYTTIHALAQYLQLEGVEKNPLELNMERNRSEEIIEGRARLTQRMERRGGTRDE